MAYICVIVLVLVTLSCVNTQLTCYDCDPTKRCNTINVNTSKLVCENSSENITSYTYIKKRIQEVEVEKHLLQSRAIANREYQCYTLVLKGSNQTENGVFRGCLAITDGFNACDLIQDELIKISNCTSCDTRSNCNDEDVNIGSPNINGTVQKDDHSHGNTFYPKIILITLLLFIFYFN